MSSRKKHGKGSKSVRVIRIVNRNKNYLNFDPDFLDLNGSKNQQN